MALGFGFSRGLFQTFFLSTCFRLPSLRLLRACTPHRAWRRFLYACYLCPKTQGKLSVLSACFLHHLFLIGSIITGKIVNCRGQSLQNMLFFELICTWRPRLTRPSRTGSAFGYLFPSLALHSDESSFSCSLRHLTILPPPAFVSLQNFRVSS